MQKVGLAEAQWEHLMLRLVEANLWLQGACLFIVLPWLLVSSRRLRLRAADLPTVSPAGWLPFRDPRLLRGSLGIVLALLVQAMWVAVAWSAEVAQKAACATYGLGTTECGGMQWLGPVIYMMFMYPGAIALSAIFHLVALRLIRTARDANEWTWKMSLRERPALTLVCILRYSPFAWHAFFVEREVALLLVAFMASFFVYDRFKRNKKSQTDLQGDSGS